MAPARAQRLSARFAPLFEHFLVTFHPDLPGEVKGKSSNLTWAAQRVEDELIATGRLDPANLIVTVCDADSRLHRGYLAALGHDVLTPPERPPAHLPAGHPVLCQSLAPDRAAPRAEQHLLALGAGAHGAEPSAGHPVDLLAELVGGARSRLLGCRRHPRRLAHVLQGAVPLRPARQGAADLSARLRRRRRGRRRCGARFENQYHQILRWAWGVSDIPYVALGALRARDLPWHTRIMRVVWYVEEHLMWPSHWFLLTLGGSGAARWSIRPTPTARSASGRPNLISADHGPLPAVPAAGHPRRLAAATRAPRRRRPDRRAHRLGVVRAAAGGRALVLCALPALDAHTRLLFGRRLEYRVTEKVPVQARFRGRTAQPAACRWSSRSSRRAREPLRRARFEQLPQYRAYAPGSTTAVTDSVLLVYRDLR